MPAWSKIAAGVAIAVVLLAFAGLRAITDRTGAAVEDIYARPRARHHLLRRGLGTTAGRV